MNLFIPTIAASRRRTSWDADAADYFSRIATAGSSISEANKAAVNAFVVGCKADGIWTPIKAACLLCAADDLTGALVPLVGAAPTNNGFVSGDYSRTAGLIGNGTSKYLASNRNNNADPQDSKHLAAYSPTAAVPSADRFAAGVASAIGHSQIGANATNYFLRANYSVNAGGGVTGTISISGLYGVSRSDAANQIHRVNGTSTSYPRSSAAPTNAVIDIFRRGTTGHYWVDGLSFYSIGEAIDLALLDARLATLMSSLS